MHAYEIYVTLESTKLINSIRQLSCLAPTKLRLHRQCSSGETKLNFWSTGKTAKKNRSVGRQNKNNII